MQILEPQTLFFFCEFLTLEEVKGDDLLPVHLFFGSRRPLTGEVKMVLLARAFLRGSQMGDRRRYESPAFI